MAINTKTSAQTIGKAGADASCKCATSALIDYNTQFGTVTIPFGYFREMLDRVLPDKYIQCEEKLNTLRRMMKRQEEKDLSFLDLEDIRMVIGDE